MNKSNTKVLSETKAYDLKLKMYLGLDLFDEENTLVKKWFLPKGETVFSYSKKFSTPQNRKVKC